jgi:hypothetical protein
MNLLRTTARHHKSNFREHASRKSKEKSSEFCHYWHHSKPADGHTSLDKSESSSEILQQHNVVSFQIELLI